MDKVTKQEIERFKEAYDWQTKLILLIQHNNSRIDILHGSCILEWIENLIREQISGTIID